MIVVRDCDLQGGQDGQSVSVLLFVESGCIGCIDDREDAISGSIFSATALARASI